MATVYMIRNREGQYSNGGSWPHFSKRGKMWRRVGDLKTHLSQVESGNYKHTEIVTFEMLETGTYPTLAWDRKSKEVPMQATI